MCCKQHACSKLVCLSIFCLRRLLSPCTLKSFGTFDFHLMKAQVVASTCSGAGDARLERHVFRAVVVDEATQATEPSTLIPLLRGAQCVVLAVRLSPECIRGINQCS